MTDETYDAKAELLEHAAEAMTIIDADDKLSAAFAEVLKAKLEAKAATRLYDALKTEVSVHRREVARWKRKAEKAAICSACRVNLERDDE